MSNVLSELQYSDNHQWIRNDGDGNFCVGLTDYAQELLGDMVFVELPEEGDVVATGDECAVVESVKTATELFSPISGVIIEVNHELIDAPGLINNDPYHDGWIFKLQADDETELDDLLSSDEYEEMILESDISDDA